MKIENILSALEVEGVEYAIVGAVAVVLYGYVRFTKDIDLVLNLSSGNIARFAQVMLNLNFRPGVPINPLDIADAKKREEWIKEKNVRVITFYNPDDLLIQIDVLITKDFHDITAVRKKIDDLEISIVAYDDLIKMKRETGRTVDILDIERLERIKDA